MGAVAKQAKALEAKLRIERGEEEEEGGSGEDDEAGDGLWGANKRAYYGADTGDLEGSEAEEDAQDEEAEARRLQREAAEALQPEDFGLSGGERSSSEEEEEGEEGGEAGPGVRGMLMVEEVEKDLSRLTEAQKRALVEESAQELTALIGELRASLAEVRSRVGPLLQEVREGQLATAEGVSYLEAKHLLLLHYCAALVFYLLLKAEGRPVQNHPVILRLVEIRAYLVRWLLRLPLPATLVCCPGHSAAWLSLLAPCRVSWEGPGDQVGMVGRASDALFGLCPPLLS